MQKLNAAGLVSEVIAQQNKKREINCAYPQSSLVGTHVLSSITLTSCHSSIYHWGVVWSFRMIHIRSTVT